MNLYPFSLLRVSSSAFAAAVAISSCSFAQELTDFNQVGKQMSIILQNYHFARTEFTDKLAQEFLETYLQKVDPNKIFLTQEDVDYLTKKYGSELDDYLLSGQVMTVAEQLHLLYRTRAAQRLNYARSILKDGGFTFDRDASIARVRRKTAVRPKNEAEMNQLWHDTVEEQLLAEILRRDTISRLAKEQGKPDPLVNEKQPEEKLLMRYERLLRNLEETDKDEIAETFLDAVCLTYDPHTNYMGARTLEQFKQAMSSELIGIGALLGSEDDGSTKINGIVVGGPADKSGELQLNDRIIAVDSNNTGEMTDILFMKLDKVIALIRGKEGSTIRMKVEPENAPGQAKIVTLTRSKVPLKDELAKGRIIDFKTATHGNEKIGIIYLPSFYADMDGGARRCATDFKKILDRMVKEQINGLVVDLRYNGGGSLEEVRQMIGFFIGSGPVVLIKDSGGSIEKKIVSRREQAKPLFNGPIVVLINKGSASASEIFAAALQDYGRAVIVGSPSSFGKGTVQQPIELGRFLPYFSSREGAGLLKITTQKFYRISGGSTQLKGVESDIVLPSAKEALDIGEGTMDHALPYDKIDKVAYKKFTDLDSILPTLKNKSAKRIAQDKDFQIAQEEYDLIKKRIDENKLSLNKKVREEENATFEARRKAINAERKKRFSILAEQDAKDFTSYRLTLDDVNAEMLPVADPKKDNEEFMHVAEDPTEKLDEAPEYPSGLDPELREGINIVRDMISLEGKNK